jgi:hypothetical protein
MRAPGLAVEILDAAGNPVAPAAPLILPHRPEDLREAPLEALIGADGLGTEPVGLRPGEPREVQAVIGPLPRAAHHVRVVASEPAALARAPEPSAPALEPGAAPVPATGEAAPTEVAPPAAAAP